MRFLLLCIIISSTVFGQNILDNSDGQVLGEQPFFNSNFIKKAKIKKIKGYYSTKASLDIIRSSNQIYTYEFDKEGRLIREYLTKDLDTIVKLYTYDSESRISNKAESNYLGFTSTHYTYDSLNRITLTETRRETNLNKSKIDFDKDESYEMSKEKFEYEKLEKGNYKKKYYNASNRVYKEEIFYHEQSKIKSQELRMMMGNARKTIKFKYDDKGSVSEYYSESWVMGHNTTKYTYEYDEKGRVLAKYYFKNGHYKTEYQIIYEPQTSYLNSILIRDEATDFITILSFDEYYFYE